MSQYYPPQGPFYPPERNPESDYYYDEDDYEVEENGSVKSSDSFIQRVLIFLAGGFTVFLCMSCCGLLATGLWLLDPGSSLLVAAPLPGSDIGLSFADPAYPNESVVTEQQVQLTILGVNRNAVLPTVPAVEGRELIIMTIELVNLGDEEVAFSERDFMLLNGFEEAYPPLAGSTTGIEGALGRGTLPACQEAACEGQEGRLVFEVIAGERDLVLTWDSGGGNPPRYIYLE